VNGQDAHSPANGQQRTTMGTSRRLEVKTGTLTATHKAT
jgi:hypothetical protein